VVEPYLSLPREDRLEALQVVASESGRPVHLLEKDIWVVWALDGLFASALGEHLVFKGGTSLSKGYGIIERFSEDVDLTYDIREIIPELVGDGAPIPATNSQADRWTKRVNEKLAAWVKDHALPVINKHVEATGVDLQITVEGANIYIDYEPLVEGSGYVAPRVKLEFGARSTGEPSEKRSITCDAAGQLPDLEFPTAMPNVMLPKRTFWEKATAIHVYCSRGTQADRYARHWHDLIRLDDKGYAQAAFDDKALAKDVAEFKGKFFRARDIGGNPIDYMAVVSGHLKLVPDAEALKALEADYKKMADDGILLDDAEKFVTLVARCEDLQKRANAQT
jgi:hypothetical protein